MYIQVEKVIFKNITNPHRFQVDIQQQLFQMCKRHELCQYLNLEDARYPVDDDERKEIITYVSTYDMQGQSTKQTMVK